MLSRNLFRQPDSSSVCCRRERVVPSDQVWERDCLFHCRSFCRRFNSTENRRICSVKIALQETHLAFLASTVPEQFQTTPDRSNRLDREIKGAHHRPNSDLSVGVFQFRKPYFGFPRTAEVALDLGSLDWLHPVLKSRLRW
jgi:hypothetical protein